MRSVTQLPCLRELHIGQSDNFSRTPKVLHDNPFSVCLKLFALLAKDAPIQNLERLHICASYLQRGVTPSLDDALERISNTFTNLTLLSIRYASLLLSSPESIKSLSNLKRLETLDMRKCEIPVLKFTDNAENYSNARTTSWCDEYMQYFPKTLKTLYIETG